MQKRPSMKSAPVPVLETPGDEKVKPPIHHCVACKVKIFVRLTEAPVFCVSVCSESRLTFRAICDTNHCRTTHRANFAYQDGVKVNALSFKQMQDSGVYMEKSRFGFSMKYLGLSLLRFLRGNLAPGQEASVRSLLSEDDDRAITSTNFQLYLQRALEGFALAQRNKDKVVPFAVDRPAEYIAFTTDPFLFATPVPVKVLSFDGHFGLHSRLHPDHE